MGDFWRDVKAARQQRKEERLPRTLEQVEMLRHVPHFAIVVHNLGNHLACSYAGRAADFYPTTGKWVARGMRRSGFGIESLCSFFGLKWKEVERAAALDDEQLQGIEKEE